MRHAAAVGAVVAAAALAGCGGDGADGSGGERLVVSAAASLTKPLQACAREFDGATVRLSFAGSDELAAQIRRGVRPDVFAAANTTLPEALAREGLAETPRVFATNMLAVAVARDSQVQSFDDLGDAGVTIAAGTEDVPVGSYTRKALGRLAPPLRTRIERNIRSEEPNVTGVLGKVAQGAVDAGFVYASDIATSGGRVRVVDVPTVLRPEVQYGVAIVRGAPNRAGAERFVASLVRGGCQRALRAAGFGRRTATAA